MPPAIPGPAPGVAASVALSSIERVPLAQIDPNPDQPREVFAPRQLEELAASIRQFGVLLPLVGWRAGGRVILVAGERRLRAAGLAGLAEVPVRLLAAPPSEAERLELALIENLQRADLDPLEAAAGYQRLIQQHGYTHERVAERVGLDRASVTNLLRLLRLPGEIQAAIREGRISAGHGRALIGLEPERQRELLARVEREGLPVRALERIVAQGRAPRAPRPQAAGIGRVERELCRIWGGRVEVREAAGGAGRITLHYRDAGDRERILARLQEAPEDRAGGHEGPGGHGGPEIGPWGRR